jgi:hypothetical protein
MVDVIRLLRVMRPVEIIGAIIGAILAIWLLSSCAAAPMAMAAAGYATSGGVTLYKSQTNQGPTAEFVLFKVEIHHDVYNVPLQK